jgi:hypothetical protein
MTSEDGGRDAAGADLSVGGRATSEPEGWTGEPDEWGAEPPRVPRPRTPPEQPVGPPLLNGDSWVEIDPGGVGDDVYQGRRRATLPARRRWVVVAVILGGLAAIVLIPLSMTSLLGVNDTAGPATTQPFIPPSDGGVPVPPVLTPESATPTPAASATPTRTAPPRTTRRARPSTSRPPNPPAPPPQPATFGPLSLEAEGPSATREGSTIIWDYDNASGGRIVGRVGDWDLPAGPGTVRFNGVAIPANGTYSIRIHFVHVNGERNRTGVVTISGLDPITTSFQGSDDCCGVKTLSVALTAGTKTITISNSNGHGPALDRIVISRP